MTSTTIFGGQSTRTVMGSIFSSSVEAIPKPPNGSRADCSRSAVCRTGIDHGQSQEARRRHENTHTGCRASPAYTDEWPRRSVAPTYAPAGAPDAAVQIAPPSANALYPHTAALNVFYLRCYRIVATQYRVAREVALSAWSRLTCVQKAVQQLLHAFTM
jgi:hypothetical protein